MTTVAQIVDATHAMTAQIHATSEIANWSFVQSDTRVAPPSAVQGTQRPRAIDKNRFLRDRLSNDFKRSIDCPASIICNRSTLVSFRYARRHRKSINRQAQRKNPPTTTSMRKNGNGLEAIKSKSRVNIWISIKQGRMCVCALSFYTPRLYHATPASLSCG